MEKIIQNSSTNFQGLKVSFVELQGKDSIYKSLIIVDGTKKNEILLFKEMSIYSATIIDSVKQKRGQRIIDDWKEKLNESLVGFTLEKIQIEAWKPALYGWKFSNGNTWIDLTLYPQGKSSSISFASFSVTYLKE